MAEFQEVCKQWKRICDSMQKSAAREYRPCAVKCPVGRNPVCGELSEATPQDIERFEAAVMAWAAEHPEPVYPTWVEWLDTMGLIGPYGNITVHEENSMFCRRVKTIKQSAHYERIPADIAEKLGIEPKEG